MPDCYCGSSIYFENCCQPFIENKQFPSTAEQLMRSRYVAYVLQKADYLLETTHRSVRKFHNKKHILNWAKSNHWLKLEVINATETTVEFKAYYIDDQLIAQRHHEKSNFLFENGRWFYVDGVFF